MWHSNYPYWNEVLRAKQNFPAVKISNKIAYYFLKKKNMEDHDRCLAMLRKSTKVAEIVKKFDELWDKADTLNKKLFDKH
jgi:hypothetical protein